MVSLDRPGDVIEGNFGLAKFVYDDIWREH
jgi:hypothetical protein